MVTRPARHEAAGYYWRYIDRVPDGDIVRHLGVQGDDVRARLQAIPQERSRHRPAPEAWTLREVAGHLSDAERLFVARAFWFARGFDTALPSFDQHVAVAAAQADRRSWADLIDEFREVRAATVTFLRTLPPEAWDRHGVASGHHITVRALAWLAAGHVAHHVELIERRVLGEAPGPEPGPGLGDGTRGAP